ncbi:VRR-NUC domain-containing protein [candidate division KSB1 bacterium]|nr:VRR-NUC domain-containing protein [candidate division KSB1 bacterium]
MNAIPRRLPRGYYRDNFLVVLEYVIASYSDILLDEEIAFYDRFIKFSLPAQRLYVRLISRKGPLFRADKLQYQEIPDLPGAASELSAAGFLAINPQITVRELTGILTKPELLNRYGDQLAHIKNNPKSEQVACLESNFGAEPQEVSAFMPDRLFDVYKPMLMAFVRLYQLLFFGNLRQDLTEFVLLDLGLLRYESYTIDPKDRLFSDRQSLEMYLLLAALKEQCVEIQPEKDVSALLAISEQIPRSAVHPGLERRRSELLNLVARELERLQRPEKASELYEASTAPPARERRARILVKLDRERDALALAQQIVRQPSNEHELAFGEQFVSRLGKKLGKTVAPAPRFACKTTELVLPQSGQKVEQAALNYYAQNGYDAYYVENSLMRGLFGLAFWDIIFMPVSGCFFNKYQRGPLDIYTDDFRRQREKEINNRLSEISADDEWHEKLLDQYQAKFGINNYLVNWSALDENLLRRACNLIPRNHLVAIFSRLSFDLRNNRRGFPDLILFKESQKSYKWVEIKGPGDRLQANQKRWLMVFEQANIPYEVVYVSWRLNILQTVINLTFY